MSKNAQHWWADCSNKRLHVGPTVRKGYVEVIAKMKELGFTTLLNENVILKIGEQNLMIAGVRDPAGENAVADDAPNAKQTATTYEKVDLKILLAHKPDACEEAEGLGFDLPFSGHTHAGQFFPFSLFIGLAHRYAGGLYQHGRMWAYVNLGSGYWGPADRLGVRSEITLVTLDMI